MIVFTQSGSTVKITNNATGDIIVFPTANATIKKINATSIKISSGNESINIDYADVTTPSCTSVDDLISQLSSSFFFDVSSYTLIGTIDAADLNGAALGVTDIDFVFSNAKPLGQLLVGLFFKNVTAFVADTYYGGYDDNSVEEAFLKENASIDAIGDANVYFPSYKLDNITVGVILESVNEGNWLQGSIEVYAELKKYPI